MNFSDEAKEYFKASYLDYISSTKERVTSFFQSREQKDNLQGLENLFGNDISYEYADTIINWVNKVDYLTQQGFTVKAEKLSENISKVFTEVSGLDRDTAHDILPIIAQIDFYDLDSIEKGIELINEYATRENKTGELKDTLDELEESKDSVFANINTEINSWISTLAGAAKGIEDGMSKISSGFSLSEAIEEFNTGIFGDLGFNAVYEYNEELRKWVYSINGAQQVIQKETEALEKNKPLEDYGEIFTTDVFLDEQYLNSVREGKVEEEYRLMMSNAGFQYRDEWEGFSPVWAWLRKEGDDAYSYKGDNAKWEYENASQYAEDVIFHIERTRNGYDKLFTNEELIRQYAEEFYNSEYTSFSDFLAAKKEFLEEIILIPSENIDLLYSLYQDWEKTDKTLSWGQYYEAQKALYVEGIRQAELMNESLRIQAFSYLEAKDLFLGNDSASKMLYAAAETLSLEDINKAFDEITPEGETSINYDEITTARKAFVEAILDGNYQLITEISGIDYSKAIRSVQIDYYTKAIEELISLPSDNIN